MSEDLLLGAWDLHVHAAPSLFPRWGGAWELACACRDAGMGGLVIKAHHGSTIESAALLDQQFAGLRVFGGLVLNQFVGGINPLAVEQCIVLGGRIVWLPTIHAAQHGAVFKTLGGFSYQHQPLTHTPTHGLTILDHRGALQPQLQQILELLDGTDVVLGTGHLGPAEILALSRAIADSKRAVRLLINHVFFSVPALSIEQLRQLQGDQNYFELCYLSITEMTRASNAQAMAQALRTLPDARWVLATDSGQVATPPAPVALQRFCSDLTAAGVASTTLRRALTVNPRELFESKS